MASSRGDPFPMQSDEAKRLAASVEEGPKGAASNNWHHMTLTDNNGSNNGNKSEQHTAASHSLMGGSKKKNQADKDEDEYDNDDQEDEEDEFLDRPLWESQVDRRLVRILRVLERMYKRLYGDKLPVSEMLRTLCLATTLFFMIGGYWLMRSLKDPILTALCGVSVIPKAKMLSVFVVLGVVSIYNHLLDSDIPKHRLFYVFGTFYFGLFITIALLLKHPTIGLANQQPNPMRLLGWVSYCSIESFGSVMVSLFWSFANSNISLETAKASYGVMVATAQVGSILGPTIVNQFAESWGVANCYLIGACIILLLQVTMSTYVRIYGTADLRAKAEEDARAAQQDATDAPKKKKKKAGILEGLQLFWKYNYVKGIFAISCLFMVEVTIVDFTMKMLARDYFAEEHPCQIGQSCYNAITGQHGMSEDATAAFTRFMGFFGQATNTLSFLMSLFGTSAIIRYLGLRLTLLLFPSLCLAVIIFVRLYPSLFVVFGAMMMLKANSYALNNPTKEILYQPTSPAVKYKAKSWIDIFGARGSKALGSVVTNAFSDSATNLVANGSLVGMCVASFLIWNARFMGAKFDEYTSSGYIVGDEGSSSSAIATEDEHEAKNIEMASNQNESEDTSCAIVDDDDDDHRVGREEEGQQTTTPEKPEVTMV